MQNKRQIISIAIAIAVTAALTCIITSAYFIFNTRSGADKFAKLNSVINALDDKFYQDIDVDAMLEGAIDGAVKSLGDPYTNYMNAEDWGEFNEMISGKYDGIGVYMYNKVDEDRIFIIPMDNSPAIDAGVQSLDKIISVNGVEVFAEDMDYALNNIRGKKGTTVTLVVQRKADDSIEELTITRDTIYMESVSSEVIDSNGYIRISSFDEQTHIDFRKHLNELLGQNITGLIIDLRSNGGGLVDTSTAIADMLLPDCVIVYTEDKYGKREYTKSKASMVDIPLVLLIDGGTASASEILAGALRDNGRATLVGETSFGKGLIQAPVIYGDGTALKITIQRYFTPSGEDINKSGINPDVEVIIPPENYPLQSRDDDTQLYKALEILKSK